jgi:hypothetical protein
MESNGGGSDVTTPSSRVVLPEQTGRVSGGGSMPDQRPLGIGILRSMTVLPGLTGC